MKIVVCTGGFDPVHSGHIAYLTSASQLGDILIVGLNSDDWLKRKKGRAFMPFEERAAIIQNLGCVYQVLHLNDEDGTGADGIRQVRAMYPDAEIVFANGGDRNTANVPEQVMFASDTKVSFVFGVGGDWKQNSSRWILNEWKAPQTDRPWGNFRLLYERGVDSLIAGNQTPQLKLKELTVLPGKSLSMQKHAKRKEFWFVAEGVATVYTLNSATDVELVGVYKQHEHIWVGLDEWHHLCNETDQPLQLIEIQYGEECAEDDIERK